MEYLADTVAIVRHLRRHPALGRQARQILAETDQGHHRVFVSAITLMEVLYLAEAKRIDVGLHDLVQVISASQNYSIIPVDAEVVEAALPVDDVPELHDRILVGTARHLGVPILTGDHILARSRHVTTIW
jgi:predicted nucleic acid-binding protein